MQILKPNTLNVEIMGRRSRINNTPKRQHTNKIIMKFTGNDTGNKCKIYFLRLLNYTIFDCVLVGPIPLKRPKYQTPAEI